MLRNILRCLLLYIVKCCNVTWKPKEEWLIFHNTHEAIVEQEIWDMAQKCRKVRRRTDTMGEANPLTGLVYCSDCGRRMYNHRSNACETTDKRNGKVIKKKAKDTYCCSLYHIYRTDCTMHYNNEAEFTELVREASDVRQDNTAKSHKRQIVKNEKRIAELDTLFKKTYEDFAAGRLSEKRFN